jgi:phenylpropionate dioxygenase-like ring-hydroxylating dioxygenase large terminal subunit
VATIEERPAVTTYGAYYHREVPREDHELTHVGPGTPCGEYFRRFWQPVGLSAELNDLPKAVRILGEDLVLFRDGQSRVGLLELHCSHRGTSLEFGTIESAGIRCCYHGWMYGVDGRILDTPGEPPESAVKDRFCHGAYPTREYKGLVFAYMGPPEKQPAFPILDMFEKPGYRLIAQGHTDASEVEPCNWLQLAENNMDAVHTIFLHALEEGRANLDQYRPGVTPDGSMERYLNEGVKEWEAKVSDVSDEYQHQRVIEWRETPTGLMYIHTLRVGEMVWVRLADYIMPNIDQIPRTLPVAEASRELDFDPPRTTTWTIPVDDTHTISFGFQYKPERLEGNPPSRWRFTSPQASLERAYEDRQRQPGDYEGQVSQRPIAVHALEHLGWSDQGVIMIRKQLREGIRAVQRGEDPKQLVALSGKRSIGTYAQSTVMRVPPADDREADKALLREVGRKVFAQRHAVQPAP